MTSAANDRGALTGVTVLVTRPTDHASRLSTALREESAQVVELPTIRIDPPTDWTPVDEAIADGPYHWVVFSSANGVELFLQRFESLSVDVPQWFSGVKVGAIGPETARVLRAHGITPALVPDEYVAEAFIAQLEGSGAVSQFDAEFHSLVGQRILIPTADIGRDTLEVGLRAAGAIVRKVTAYRTVRPEAPVAVLERLRQGEIDAATFTSSSTVTNLVAMLGADADCLRPMILACIGPVTAETVRTHGFEPAIIATTYTIPGLVSAMSTYYRNHARPTEPRRLGALIPPSGLAADRSSVAIDRSSVAIDRSSLAADRSSVAIDRSSVAIDRSGLALDPSGLVLDPSRPRTQMKGELRS